ncbi:MAG TPA: hypothetical protein VHW60_15205 [Caulobacteraceae bacterium]|jgi:hypothetical protein|nr:hypothetical protein [Caulobacteraceae bacterium]
MPGWDGLRPDRPDVDRRIEDSDRRIDVIDLSDQAAERELVVLDLAGDLGTLASEGVQDVGLLGVPGMISFAIHPH